ncbi:MAG: UDP-N-acetylmuramoyl-L-alanine--D-glutamate ligase [Coraliomargaritaceae bacterium]
MKKCVAVFGAGLSGQSVAKLAQSEGHTVTVFDENTECRNNFTQSDVSCFDDFIFSPGFSKIHPWRVLLSGHDSLYGELGYAAERWKGKVFAVTGTNGKTTVTRLLEAVLRASGEEAYAVGNIGLPFSDLVNSKANHVDAIAVCEISSFQAEMTKGLSLEGLIWTNFAEDHLDRYENMEDYFQSKFALFSCLKKSATVCISEDLLAFKAADFWQSHGAKIVKVDRDLPELVEGSSVFQSYPHLYNFNLVCGFIEALGLKGVDVVSLANDFKLDEHRLSKIFEKGGLKIWEDSKSTNLHSVLGAMRGMKGKVIWIGGGVSKNTDISKFTNSLAPLVDSVVVYGAVGEALNEAFLNLGTHSIYYPQLADAIQASVRLSEEQNEVNILFSPGFASFDQFDSYSDRGNFFQKTIFSLLKG